MEATKLSFNRWMDLQDHMKIIWFTISGIVTWFLSNCTTLQFTQKCMSIPISPHQCLHLFYDFLIPDILMFVKWYHIVILVYISLMNKNMMNLFQEVIINLYVFLRKNMFSDPLFINSLGCFSFCIIEMYVFLKYCDKSHLSDIQFSNIFSHS